MVKVLIRSIILCLCYFSCNSAMADPVTDIYQIEVIVFEHTDPKRFAAEHWPKFVGHLNTKNAVKLNDLKSGVPEALDTLETLDALDDVGDEPLNKIVQDSITLVEAKNMHMNEEARMLKTSKIERFIQHIAWSQPLAISVRSTPVYFYAGKNQEIATVMSIKPARNMFNVSLDVIYKIQAADREYGADVNEIRLTRDVKVKKKEVYYVDHPVIGMLIMITPVILDN